MLNEAIAIAHEFKQPLTAVIANGNFCLRQLAESSPNLNEMRAALEEIIDSGNRAILIISRIGSLLAKQSRNRSALDINDVLSGAFELLRRELDRSGTNLTIELASDLPAVTPSLSIWDRIILVCR